MNTKTDMHDNSTARQPIHLRVALVHDFLVDLGGAERVLEAMAEMFPEAPIYTLIYDKEKTKGKFSGRDVHTSFLQKFPGFLKRRRKLLLPFLPVAPETFDLRDFDLVVSSSGAWSKGIISRLNTIHISYMHSPMRFVWDKNEEYLLEQKKAGITNFFSRLVTSYIRLWDKMAADRPDYLVSNSIYTKKRLQKYYGRESEVIYPPVNHVAYNMKRGTVSEKKYFLVVSRLSPYKKIDNAILAFNKLRLPLVIVGTGSQEKYLRSIAGQNVKFFGWQSDEKLSEIYAGARAFVFPGVDDFGIAPVEAMNHGIPILAVKKGGIVEIIEERKTGEFFDFDAPYKIVDCVNKFVEKESYYDKKYIQESAKKFSKEKFKEELERYVDQITRSA